MTRLRISIVSICLSVFLAGLVSWPGASAADQDGAVLEDVRMGEPGDRWLDQMQYRKIERTSKDGVFGYAITYDGSDGNDLIFFFPRGVIDLTGENPWSGRMAMDVPGGRIWVPERVTSRSLPRVYEGILYIDGKFRKEARGGIEAMKGFVLVLGAADAAPVLTTMTTRIFTSRVSSSGGIALVEVTSSGAAKAATGESARITTSSTAAATARTSHTASATTGPKIETTGSIEAAERSVPTSSRLVRERVTAGATVRRTTSSTGGSPQALAKALEEAGYKRPVGTAVHHIVARNAPKAEPAREVLQKFGIGIDDAVNGVFLPATKKSLNPTGASVHSTLHTDKYYKAVNELLASATTRAEVVERLSSIRVRLLRGTMVR